MSKYKYRKYNGRFIKNNFYNVKFILADIDGLPAINYLVNMGLNNYGYTDINGEIEFTTIESNYLYKIYNNNDLIWSNWVLIDSDKTIDLPLETPFIITVDTTLSGTTATNQFYLPIIGTDFIVETSEQTLINQSADYDTGPTLEWTTGGIKTIKVILIMVEEASRFVALG